MQKYEVTAASFETVLARSKDTKQRLSQSLNSRLLEKPEACVLIPLPPPLFSFPPLLKILSALPI